MDMIRDTTRLVGWIEAAELLAEPAKPAPSNTQFGVLGGGADARATLSLPAGTRLWLPDGDAPIGVVYRELDAVYLGTHGDRAVVELPTNLGTVRLAATGP